MSVIHANSLFYLAGYISFKCKRYQECKYSFSGFAHDSDQKSKFSAWLFRISKGYLSLPSTLFWDQVQILEKEFQSYFSNSGQTGIHLLIDSLSRSHPEIPIQLIRYFIRTRLFFRIRFQNQLRIANKRSARKVAKFLS